jgi:hypothetical protein
MKYLSVSAPDQESHLAVASPSNGKQNQLKALQVYGNIELGSSIAQCRFNNMRMKAVDTNSPSMTHQIVDEQRENKESGSGSRPHLVEENQSLEASRRQ